MDQSKEACGRFCLLAKEKRDGKGEGVLAEGTETGPSPLGRWRVVVADHHARARVTLKQVLSQQPDLQVVGEAQDGYEALELCRRLQPDLVLMEARLPKIDGIEATRRIKREFPGIPVLVMNTLGAPDQLLEALKERAAGYVLKTSGPQRISDAVHGALMGENPLDENLVMQLLRRMIDEMSN
jgi:DNA-binding NarL/FixJ family response regulator